MQLAIYIYSRYIYIAKVSIRYRWVAIIPLHNRFIIQPYNSSAPPLKEEEIEQACVTVLQPDVARKVSQTM